MHTGAACGQRCQSVGKERVIWLVPIVTRALVGGASETGGGGEGAVSLSSDFTRDGPALNITGNV